MKTLGFVLHHNYTGHGAIKKMITPLWCIFRKLLMQQYVLMKTSAECVIIIKSLGANEFDKSVQYVLFFNSKNAKKGMSLEWKHCEA